MPLASRASLDGRLRSGLRRNTEDREDRRHGEFVQAITSVAKALKSAILFLTFFTNTRVNIHRSITSCEFQF
jgi:hypothetical protein